jgi:hypothetical protein
MTTPADNARAAQGPLGRPQQGAQHRDDCERSGAGDVSDLAQGLQRLPTAKGRGLLHCDVWIGIGNGHHAIGVHAGAEGSLPRWCWRALHLPSAGVNIPVTPAHKSPAPAWSVNASAQLSDSPTSLLGSTAATRFFAGSCLAANSKVFELGTGFQPLSQPDGLRSSSSPRIACVVAVFDGNFSAFQRAPTALFPGGAFVTQPRKLGP